MASPATRGFATAVQGNMADGFWKGPVDFVTLVLLMAGGIELGLIGLFGFSFLTWLLGSWKTVAYDAIGLGTVWQFFRQGIFA